MPKNVIIIGAGGHAKVIADIIIKCGDILLGFLDDDKKEENILGFPILGKIDEIEQYIGKAEFIIGIGDNYKRKEIAENYDADWYTAIHPCAQIGLCATIASGSAVMANAVINACAKIGKHCIINTGSIVEHDCKLADYVNVSPSGVLCGNADIGECTFIGASAAVKNNIKLCADVTIGVGGVVVKDITKKGIYVGIPAIAI